MCHRIWLGAGLGMLSAVAMAFPARAQISRTPSPYTARTGAEFVAACNSDQLGCDGKVADVLLSGFSPTTHICLPGPSYAGAVAPWLKAHPETAPLKTDEAISLALSTLYRCGPPRNY